MLHAIYPDKFQTKHFAMGLISQILGFNCPKKCGYNNIFIEKLLLRCDCSHNWL